MKKAGITKSILSITSPGTHLKPGNSALAKEITRRTNIELSQACSEYPQQFDFFASLPLPEIEASIEEIDYALDCLGAKGFALMSNANGIYLGDTSLDLVFEKLNQRKAIVFIHPTSCNVLRHDDGLNRSGPEVQIMAPLPQFPRPMMEFMFDGTRAVTNLLLSGTVAKYPNITYIMSHCGCVLPPLLERISWVSAYLSAANDGNNHTQDLRDLLKTRFYFDLAGCVFPDQIHGLLGLVGPERLVHGSDYPFTPEKMALELADKMGQGMSEIFEKEQIQEIYQGSAKKLLGL